MVSSPISSVQFICSVVSESLGPHEPQHTRPPCPSPTPGVYSNSCPLSRWSHTTISSSVVPFSSRLQYFPESESFPMSQFFASGGQRIGVWQFLKVWFLLVQSLSHVRLFVTHELEHARPPCPSPTPGVHSDSRPSSQWCHPTISSSVVPFSSHFPSFPASGSFPMSQFFASGGQSNGALAVLCI